jgi:hypothetical protein
MDKRHDTEVKFRTGGGRRIERKEVSYAHFVKVRVECIASVAGHLKLSASGKLII